MQCSLIVFCILPRQPMILGWFSRDTSILLDISMGRERAKDISHFRHNTFSESVFTSDSDQPLNYETRWRLLLRALFLKLQKTKRRAGNKLRNIYILWICTEINLFLNYEINCKKINCVFIWLNKKTT